MTRPAPSITPPSPARYGLPQAAGETLFLVGLSMFGLLARRLPVIGPFAVHLVMGGVALLLLYQAEMRVTWWPAGADWRPAIRSTIPALALLLPLAAIYTHVAVIAAAPRDPGAWQVALERLAATPVWVTAGTFIKTGVVVPFAEELAFRGYLHTRLLRYDARRWQLGKVALSRAALVSAGLFTVIHLGNYVAASPVPWWLVAGHLGFVFVFGVAAAVLLEQTGSLLVPTVLHGVVNVWWGVYRLGLLAYLAARL
jgi:membrane protease YdiL (CAAX protease family)